MNKKKLKNMIVGYGFAAPSTILLLVFLVLPIFMVFYFSLTNYSAKLDVDWVGLRNYLRIFKDPALKHALKNTLIFVVVQVPVVTVFSLVTAALLAQRFRNLFGNIIRSAMFVPVVCSMSLLGSVWYYLFSSDPSGMVNTILGVFGIGPVDWLGQANTAMAAMCVVNIIRSVGYFMVIYYAAIMDIPKNLLEAAEVDGANKIQQFLYIILPNLKHTTNFVVVINTIWAFQVFDLAYTMTSGGPGYGTTTMIYRIYQEGFWNWKMGYACALSVTLFLLILVVSGIVKRIFRAED